MPFLCGALLGEIPHTHTHGAAAPFSACTAAPASARPALSVADDDDHCLLCEWNKAIGHCAWLALPVCLPPFIPASQIAGVPAPTVNRLTAPGTSRAPPALLS